MTGSNFADSTAVNSDLHAASREALALAEARLSEVLGEQGIDAATVGVELFSVVDLLGREPGLRRVLGDAAAESDARKGLIRTLLADKLSEPSLQIIDIVVSSRWSSPRQLVDGLESLGRSALLAGAEKTGNLDAVENQLFRIARIVAGEPGLEQALSDQTAPAESKRNLVRGLFADK